MHILYPSSPFDKAIVDENFQDEYRYLKLNRGKFTGISLLQENVSAVGSKFNLPLSLQFEGSVLYRGWMLTPVEYGELSGLVTERGGKLMTTIENYKATHWLPQWYPLLGDLTAATVVFPDVEGIVLHMSRTPWEAYFIKDFVKSLSTSQGSLVTRAEDIPQVISRLKHFRGFIEGGICVRKGEVYLPDSERRYFVLKGTAYGTSDDVPKEVLTVASRIKAPFYSVDVAIREDGKLRVIELGDGQVSDLKEWSVEAFGRMMQNAVT